MHALLHSVPPTLHQAITNPRLHWRLLDTHRQVWVSLLWGHCSLLLGPGAHKVLFVPSSVYFPVLCKFWWLCGGVNGDLLQEGLCHTQVSCTQSPCPCSSPLLTWKSREPRVSCLNPGKTSRDLLEHVSRPESPPMAP